MMRRLLEIRGKVSCGSSRDTEWIEVKSPGSTLVISRNKTPSNPWRNCWYATLIWKDGFSTVAASENFYLLIQKLEKAGLPEETVVEIMKAARLGGFISDVAGM